MSVTDEEVNALQKSEFILFVLFFRIENLFYCECSCCWGQIKTGKMSQGERFFSSEEAVPEVMRQLEEDVDSDTEVERKENEMGSRYCRRSYKMA